MNRIQQMFQKKGKILSIYFTAGYPAWSDTVTILNLLQENGVDMVEIGIPFSDPLADGPVIQESGRQALENGMTLRLLLQQLAGIRKSVHVPLVMMGYFNTIFHYGLELFLQQARRVGIDALIIPDLPLEEYLNRYSILFEQYRMPLIFLVTPQTEESRLRRMDAHTDAFLYLVTVNNITGGMHAFSTDTLAYLERVQKMKLHNPLIGGFGISDAESFTQVCHYLDGGIIGSAFIRAISAGSSLETAVAEFIRAMRAAPGAD